MKSKIAVLATLTAALFFNLTSQAEAVGTFYLASQGDAPYPFDPYGGAEPIEAINAAQNIYLVEDSADDFATLQTANRAIRAPADMIAIGDDSSDTMSNSPNNYKSGGWGEFIGSYISPTASSLIGTIHNQGGNMVFLDDHVEWQHWWKWIEFNDTAARRWNYDNQPHEEFWNR